MAWVGWGVVGGSGEFWVTQFHLLGLGLGLGIGSSRPGIGLKRVIDSINQFHIRNLILGSREKLNYGLIFLAF